jgi:hypothetical protein
MNDLWEEMLNSPTPIQVKAKGHDVPGDVYQPNGNAILFKMFGKSRNNQICVTKQNFGVIQKIMSRIFDFGGFPLIEVTNLKDKMDLPPEQIKKLVGQNRILMKFNSCIRNGKFQNVLHQFALEGYCDADIVKELS